MHTETHGGIAVTVLTAVEVDGILARFLDHAAPSCALQQEIASLAELHTAARATDDSLTPALYYVSTKTHRSWGRTAHGRMVMVCPETGALVAFLPAWPAPVWRPPEKVWRGRFVELAAVGEEVTA